MKVLVTGATGFVGATLVSRLVDSERFSVRAAVRRESGELLAGVEQIATGDLTPNTDWQQALVGVDAVVHLAARVHVMHDQVIDPLAEFRKVNVAGTERLARMAAAAGVRRFVFLSSVKVNGEGRSVPYAETDPSKPEDPYGVSKWEAEQILHEIATDAGLKVVILRPPLVYGPGVKANFLKLLQLVERGIPLPLATVNNCRSLIYLENLINAIIVCISHPKAAGQTYMVSDGEDISTPELIRRMADALGRPSRLFPFSPALMRFIGRVTYKVDVVDRLLSSLVVDTSKMHRELNWVPPFTMEQGLKETAEWFKDMKKHEANI